MTPPRDLIDRADTLIQRKRVFVAGATQTPANASPEEPEEDDIPVLTEIIDLDNVGGDAPHQAALPALAPLIEAATQAFTLELHQRFAAALPGLIHEATARLAVELQQAVHRIAEESLREFIAEKNQLSLPLAETPVSHS